MTLTIDRLRALAQKALGEDGSENIHHFSYPYHYDTESDVFINYNDDDVDLDDDLDDDLDVIMEAEYEGRKVKLNDPVRLPSGNKKKFKVYTTHPKTGNVIKVQFGDPSLSIKRDSDKRRKAFRARHGCDAVTYEDDRHTPKYWSCKMWEKDKKVSDLD